MDRRTLNDETSLHWSEITNGTYHFGREAQAAAVAASLTLPDLRAYWAERFDAGASARRKLASHVYAPRLPLPPKRESGVGGRRLVYVDGLEAAKAFKATLTPFPPPPRQPKPAASPK